VKIVIDKPSTLFDFLTELYPDSPRTRIKKLMQNGSVLVNNKVVTLHSHQLKEGVIVEIKAEGNPVKNEETPFPVLFEDKELVIIEKPAGIVTSSTDGSLSAQWVLSQFYKEQEKAKTRIFIVHRLDKEVSGILLLAKNQEAMNFLKDHWKETEKHYIALVEGRPKEPEGTVRSLLYEDKTQKVHSTTNPFNAKLAITHYRTLQEVNKNTLLEIRLETGRKNQIRVHMSDLGCPIIGDRKYGASKEFIRRIRLHACYFSFPHPTNGEKVIIESPMPKGFLSLKERDEKYK
jgi:23S rRNA pseudouridine1911/1915/1917 synthase